MKRFFTLAPAFLAAFLMVGVAFTSDAQAKNYKLKMSVTTSDTSTWVDGAKKFAELVNERTKGQVTVKVYPNEMLSGGNQAKGVEQLINGTTDLSFHSNIIYSVMDERFGVISMPFLFESVEDADKKLAGAGGEAVRALCESKGIEALAFGENGMRQMTTNKVITTLDDMKGLKIRIPAMKMYTMLFTALGANPLTMNFSEVFTSLQQGTIDGHENPLDTINSAKIQEVQKVLTLWDYSYDILILGMNKKLYDSMPADLQKIMRECAADACAYQKKINRERNNEYLEKFKAGGMAINSLTPENRAAFKAATQKVYTEYQGLMGEVLKSFQ